jgi:hypothetical protein
MRVKYNGISIFLFGLFTLLSFAYFYTFVVLNDGGIYILQKATNIHDHTVYVNNMKLVALGESLMEFANDKGIASIYLILSYAFPFLANEDMELMAFLFNTIIMLLCYVVYSKITDRLGLGILGRLSFFINNRFLYFTQFINKDILKIL